MPAEVLDDPLGISCVFSDGRRAVITLGYAAGSRLARDLLSGLAGLVHPHGTVDSAGSVRHYVRALRTMDTALAERGFTGGAADLRRAQVAEFWMGTTGAREACTRRMLRGFAADGGTLDARVRELAEGRAYNLQPFRRPLPPYPEADWARLTQASTEMTAASYRAHRGALAGAARGQDPAAGGCTLDNLRWLLARNGPMTAAGVAAHTGASPAAARRAGLLRASSELFPHLDVTIAYVLAFSVCSGIVPDGIDDLATGDIDWAGDTSVLLSYVKHRTAAESLVLPRRAVRLLEQWLDHSRLLRDFVPSPDRDQLWLNIPQPGRADVTAGPVNRNATRRWLTRNDVTDEEGQVLTLHRHRIRTTHESMRDKSAWRGSGRATIDPNHSPQAEGDHYLTATTPAQRDALDAIIEDAQHRPGPPGQADGRHHRGTRRRPGRRLPAAGRLPPARRRRARRARRRAAGRVHRRLRRPAVRPARPERETVPGEAVGLPPLPAGGVRSAARAEPAAAQGVLRTPVAADGERTLHGRLRPVLPAGRRDPGPLRPRRPGRRITPGQRP